MPSSPRARALAILMVGALLASTTAAPYAASAQGGQRRFQIQYTPGPRTQVAIWAEQVDGTFMGTVRLTEAVAYRGIGNRPGATQMNSGFRWPYGRREGVLPVWAHRRAAAPGAAQFRRVIFQDRIEGYASRTTDDSTPDGYFCLSFNDDHVQNLDAVTCASVFNSDKGRFITQDDVDDGYDEPWQSAPGVESFRLLDLDSLYPPRRDVLTTINPDHPDVSGFRAEALRVMPELDAITAATAQANLPQLVQFEVPSDWPSGEYVLFVEVNTEKDHNATFSEAAYPTPQSSGYDVWAKGAGFPYRGQPSVVYRVPFTLGAQGGVYVTSTPAGYGDVNGEDGDVTPIDASITDDPATKPGSGADRLRAIGETPRVTLTVLSTSVCGVPDPPAPCSYACTDDTACPEGFLCGSEGTCVGTCDAAATPGTPGQLQVLPYDDIKHSHEWASLSFQAPESRRPVVRYDVRVSPTPITNDGEFIAAVSAKAASREIQGVSLCEMVGTAITCPEPGTTVNADIGWLDRLSTYHVAVRAFDACGIAGPITSGTVETTDIDFTTVSPCFVATAAYGSPMAADVQALRTFRDQHLVTNAPGRALVAGYYAVGPYLAAFIREHDDRRALARALLAPIVRLVRAIDGE